MMNFSGFLFFLLLYPHYEIVCLTKQKIPDIRRCVDTECSGKISEAKAVIKHFKSLSGLTIKRNQNVIVYSKGVGKFTNTWGVEADGVFGYIPKDFVKEMRVFVKDQNLIQVGTPENKVDQQIEIEKLKPEVEPLTGSFLLFAGASAEESTSGSPAAPEGVIEGYIDNDDTGSPDQSIPSDQSTEVEDDEIEAKIDYKDEPLLIAEDDLKDIASDTGIEAVETSDNATNDTTFETPFDTGSENREDIEIGTSNDTSTGTLNITTLETSNSNLDKINDDVIPSDAGILSNETATYSDNITDNTFDETPTNVGVPDQASSFNDSIVAESEKKVTIENLKPSDEEGNIEVLEHEKMNLSSEERKEHPEYPNVTTEDDSSEKDFTKMSKSVEDTETKDSVLTFIKREEDKSIENLSEMDNISNEFGNLQNDDISLKSQVNVEDASINATDEKLFVQGINEPAMDSVQEEKDESSELKKDETSRGGRVKRDFMQPQYMYNYPNYNQMNNYQARMNEYNSYQPNNYRHQQQQNSERNVHPTHQTYTYTQAPHMPSVVNDKPSEPEISLENTQAPSVQIESVTVDSNLDSNRETPQENSSESVDSFQEEKAEFTSPPPQIPTSTETFTATDKPDIDSIQKIEEEEKLIEQEKLDEKEEELQQEDGELKDEQQSIESTESSQEGSSPSIPNEIEESESSWFDLKFLTDLLSSGSSNDLDTDLKSNQDIPVISPLSSQEDDSKLTDEKCTADEDSCGMNKPKISSSDDEDKDEILSSGQFTSESDDFLEALLDSLQKTSSGPIVCLVVTAFAVVAFSLGYNLIENRKRDGQLVAKINSLEKEYLVVQKESHLLKDQLQLVSEQSTSSEEYLSNYQSEISALTEECENLRAVKVELEEQLVELEKELQTVTESNLEINNLLSESLSTPDSSQVLLETVETLRGRLENQNIEMKELNRLLNEKSEELENIRKDLKTNQEAKKSLSEKLSSLKREKEEEVLQLKEANRDLSSQLDDLMESRSLEKLKLSNELSKLQIALTETQTLLGDRDGEIDALKDVISRLKINAKEEDLNELYDVARVSGKLTQAEAERDSYKEKFHEEEGARKLLEDHVQVISKEVASLKENYEAAEKEKIEALTKVQVLSNYFKEKESQLQKELGLQESMWLQKQSDDHTIYEQMKSLRDENERYKNEQSQQQQSAQHHYQRQQPSLQNGALCVTKKKKKKVKGNFGVPQLPSGLQIESLKKEIVESESDYKMQIANAEQKSYDNWLTSRQYERRLKESQNEATQLRNRLTLVEKNATNHSTDDLKQSMSESNGDPSSPPPTLAPRFMPPPTSPPFMMFQPPLPPPGDYIPPPPLVFPEARPPTLGRISSPPLDQRFSPPHHHMPPPYLFDPAPPYSGHHSPSPPPPHRPLPKTHRDMGSAEQKESTPPGYSEHKERPNRRSKR